MDDVDDLMKSFGLIVETMKKIAEGFRKIFDLFEAEKSTPPRVYGMSLVSNSHSQMQLKSYNYMPVVRKNLPYQRRRF